MPNYAYRGNEKFIEAIAGRLEAAGFTREGEIDLAECVFTFCTNASKLEDLYFGSGGLVENAPSGCVLVDMSASTPSFAMEMYGVATVNNLKMISAPLIVRNKTKEDVFAKSNLTCFVGGDEESIAEAQEVLDVIFGDVQKVRNAGAAQMARAASTIQNTAEMVSAIEVLSLFRSCKEADPETSIQNLVPDATSPEAYFIMNAIREERFHNDYTVEMLMGEISAAISTADDYNLILPETEAAFHLYELLAVIGGADLSPAALSLVYEGNAQDDDEKSASKVGLDWSRAEVLYGDQQFMGDDEDSSFYDDDDELRDFDYDDELEDEDGFQAGYGYSVN